MTLKQRIGAHLIPRLPVNRHTFNVLRFEMNAAVTRLYGRWSLHVRRLRDELARQHHLRVNLGSGGEGLDGWVNIDVARSHADQTIPWDIRSGLPFEDGQVALLFAEHVIEHIEFRKDIPRLFREIHRVLEPGGWVRIIVPDAGRWLRAYVSGDPEDWRRLGMERLPDDMLTPMAMINHVFHQDGEHFFAYDAETMHHALAEAGFETVRTMQFQQSNVPDLALDQPHHAPYSLYVEARR